MAYNTLTELMTAICDAVRQKEGSTNLISVQDIPQRILDIEVDSSVDIDISKYETTISTTAIQNTLDTLYKDYPCKLYFQPIGDLLWENSNPGASFNSNISMDLSGYKSILVSIKFHVTQGNYREIYALCSYAEKQYMTACEAITNQNYGAGRVVSFDSNGIYFLGGNGLGNASDSINDNYYAIPLKIYGIRNSTSSIVTPDFPDWYIPIFEKGNWFNSDKFELTFSGNVSYNDKLVLTQENGTFAGVMLHNKYGDNYKVYAIIENSDILFQVAIGNENASMPSIIRQGSNRTNFFNYSEGFSGTIGGFDVDSSLNKIVIGTTDYDGVTVIKQIYAIKS